MALVTTKQLMLMHRKITMRLAFNAENMEMVQELHIAAAEEMHAPVIVQTTPGTLKYASPSTFHAMAAAAAAEASVPVAIHLDHGSSFELAMQAFRAGYTSVMIDLVPSCFFEEKHPNYLARSRACHAANIPVEGSLARSAAKRMTWMGVVATGIPILQ